jgi:hypothetical protein
MSRVTGLSETGISAIGYDPAKDRLLIAYTNSNLDVVYRNDVINIPDIKRDDITGDKGIYSIYYRQPYFYLATGLGVIVIDADKLEVKETWFLGSGGGQVKVSSVTSDASFFYAATEEGLKKAPVNSADLSDFSNWQLVSGINGLSSGPCQQVMTLGNAVYVQRSDSVLVQNGINWTLFYANGLPIFNSNVSGNQLLLCQPGAAGQGRVTILNSSGSVAAVIAQPGFLVSPRKAVKVNAETWVADAAGGILHFGGTSFEQIQPNSPLSTSSGDMAVYNSTLVAAAGGIDSSWNPQHNYDGLFAFKDGLWTNINRQGLPTLDSLPDLNTVVIDPVDESCWAGSFGGGLLHGKNGFQSVEIFKQGIIGSMPGSPSDFRVAGLAFDGSHNLWVSNFGATTPLLVRKTDGNWRKISIPFQVPGNPLAQIIIDDNGFKWMIAGGSGTLLCYDHGSSIDDTGDDRWRPYTAGSGTGNLPAGEIKCIAKDKSGFIWVGTTNGIGVIQCPQEAFSLQGCDAIWPIVQQGNFAGYLFNGEEVRAIAVDGADRKWVATRRGVWLISAEGEKVIYNFNEANSPLLSNDVKKIAIDGKTGEVYFATAKGICSFRSTATEGGQVNQDVLVFPNPVPPGYTGTIAIRGLVNNAIVKITEPDGRLVYQTRALGGQATWDGRDYKGARVSSGIYLVLVSNDERTERFAARIVIIAK